ncbi:hypothetical protein JG687_00016800 [Phytophthora cactorum]|uniref:Uncharacterized protein n=1 Tax=Phytophthora cactorum TaxID=29920 RepID=A0A329RTX5_9STRA|nr:hypothetical protein Pcac1_g17112 [Phytophthora cactorum]KAG2796694.1 hypothetical protein PC112_g22095 [Phytophthora cactorum]KAG2875612.1 hypothetical protein PC114_g24624 [Phytophthora cactorum]KAG2882591.1 hypothetical protein PC115_g21901 [Phytophthora cactorum]KAG2890636.1 hypothetical protein PC117_g24422 [Phytophthora cactorum]
MMKRVKLHDAVRQYKWKNRLIKIKNVACVKLLAARLRSTERAAREGVGRVTPS